MKLVAVGEKLIIGREEEVQISFYPAFINFACISIFYLIKERPTIMILMEIAYETTSIGIIRPMQAQPRDIVIQNFFICLVTVCILY